MKRNWKRLGALLLVLVMTLALLAGCGGTTTTPPADSGTTTPPADSGTTTPPADSGSAPSGEVLEFNLSIAQPQGSSNYQKYSAFADKVAELSGGTVKFNIHAAASLYGDAEVIEAMMDGNLDAAHAHASYTIGIIKDLAVLEVPGFFYYKEAYDHESFMEWNDATYDAIDSIYSDYGLKYIAPNPPCQAVLVTAKEQVKTMDDIAGMSIRAAGTWIAKTMEGWGGVPTTIPISEMTTALERGTVEGAFTVWDVADSFKLYEVAPYVTYLHGIDAFAGLVMSQESWDKMNAEQQAWVMEAADYFIEQGVKLSWEGYDKTLANMESAGATIYMLDNEENAPWHQVCLDLYDDVAATCGEKGKALVSILEDWNAAH